PFYSLSNSTSFQIITMLLRILLIAATAYGAAIPQNPSCLEKCLVAGGIVGAAADLNFFKSVAVDINNFCNVYTALLKCASGCSQDDLNLVMKHTAHASYVCKEKLEEIKTVHDCLEADTTDPLSDCSKVCEVTEHVPLRLDSTATAPVNPNVPAEGTGPLCGKQMCVLKCAREQLNKQCAGAGDLFKEIARHQVEMGWDALQVQSENTNDTASQLVALSYLANIPEKCVYLTNLETFDKEIGGDSMKKQEMMPGMEFSNDTTVESTESVDESMGGFDASLFEFEPVLEPDVPLGPPAEGSETTTDTSPLSTFPEEAVKVIGETQAMTAESNVPATTVPAVEETTEPATTEPDTTTTAFDTTVFETTTLPAETPATTEEETTVETTTTGAPSIDAVETASSLAAALDNVSVSVSGGGVRTQPKPADAPVAGTSSETSASTDEEPAVTSAEGADKEAAMGTRPVTSGPIPEGGLIASRPVTEEDKDAGEEEDETSSGEMAKSSDSTAATEGSKSEEKAEGDDVTVEASETATATSMDGRTEEEKADGEMGDAVAGEVEKEMENKDSEGSDVTTDSTIVVDDENQSEIESNAINPVTEAAAKKNGAPASLSLLTAVFALVAVLFI
ncbi:hypothetical protein PFISCL1PPCAC_556, partial [Pristionchus fissidentatus]